jgi:hypothetical protein
VKEWLKYVLEGIKRNSLTKSELVQSLAIPAVAMGAAGAGIGYLTGDKNSRRRKAIKGAVIGGLLGGIAGPAAAQYKKYMRGIPFRNKLDLDTIKRDDKVVVGVAGAANGEGESWFASEMRDRFGDKGVMVNVDDSKRLEDIVRRLKEKGADVSIVGHSNGGKLAAKFLADHPELKGYLIDPVSWFGRKVPNNAVVFTPSKSTRHSDSIENAIATVGGRWDYDGPGNVVYSGGHSDRIYEILRDFVSNGKVRGDKLPKGKWIESGNGFGKEGSVLHESNEEVKCIEKVAGVNDPPSLISYSRGHDGKHRQTNVEYPGFGESSLAQIGRGTNRVIEKALSPITDLLYGEPAYTLDSTSKENPYGEPDDYYHEILVGGANAGGRGIFGASKLPFGVLSRAKSKALFRNGDEEGIRKEIDKSLKAGLKPRVWGHSWGGSRVAGISKDFPDVPFYSLDPVSWTGRLDKIPKNLTILRPRNDNVKNSKDFGTRLAPIVGGRWPVIDEQQDRYIYYTGDHVNGLNEAVNAIVREVRGKRLADQLLRPLEWQRLVSAPHLRSNIGTSALR